MAVEALKRDSESGRGSVKKTAFSGGEVGLYQRRNGPLAANARSIIQTGSLAAKRILARRTSKGREGGETVFNRFVERGRLV